MVIFPYFNRGNAMRNSGAIPLLVGLVVVVAIVGSALSGKEELARYQALKNKRRFSGRRLPPNEQAEFDRLAKKYWWY